MKINLSGHHVDITPGIQSAVEKKLVKIGNHHPEVETLDVIVKVEGKEQSIEIRTQFRGASISVTARDKDLYNAIQSSEKKLQAALEKRKGSLKSSRESLRDSDIDNSV